MGTWGPGIFSDDVAVDVREDYRSLLGDGVADDEVTRQVLGEYLQEREDETTVWLALAATQTVLGRLDDTVKAKALELIDRWGELPTPEELDVVPAATAMRTRGNPNVGNTARHPGRETRRCTPTSTEHGRCSPTNRTLPRRDPAR